MVRIMSKPGRYVQPIHFEDFDGAQFERLVFAFHVRAEKWQSLEWYGQTGSDLGRDIWGILMEGKSVCIQCVNRQDLTFAKIRDDLSKVLTANKGVPERFRIVARADVSATMRDRIKEHVQSAGVHHCDIWSGKEFEEFLRHGAESLLKRFVEGETFPDTEPELTTFAQTDSRGEKDAEKLRTYVARTYFAPELARIVARQVHILDRAIANFVTASVGKNPLPGDSWASLRPWKPVLYPNASEFRDLRAEDAVLLVNFYDSLQEIADIVESWVSHQSLEDFNAWNFLMQKVQHSLSVGQKAVGQFCPNVVYDATMPAAGTLLNRSERSISNSKMALSAHLARRGVS
jgi:hypothetical protein